MREIKFRGKITALDYWVYGSLIRGTCGTAQIVSPGNSAFVDPETVGQYTGSAEDRDTGESGYKPGPNDEFCEHDIIDHSTGHGGRIGEIVWNEDLAGFAVEWIPRPLRTQPWESFTCDIATMSTKLGNRHDNPELLK